MKQVAIFFVALVLGLIVGGVGPRGEVRQLREELAAIERSGRTGLGGPGIRDLLEAGHGGALPSGTTIEKPAAPRPAPDAEPDFSAHEEGERALEEGTEGLKQGLAELDQEQLELARTALDARRAQALAALVEDADPEDEQLESIEQAIDGMNADLRDLASDLIDLLNEGAVPTRYQAMSFAADTLDVMLRAEESITGALTPEQQGRVHSGSLDPFSYIDSDVIDLIEKLDARATEEFQEMEPPE